jgi:hypothetical protein
MGMGWSGRASRKRQSYTESKQEQELARCEEETVCSKTARRENMVLSAQKAVELGGYGRVVQSYSTGSNPS